VFAFSTLLNRFSLKGIIIKKHLNLAIVTVVIALFLGGISTLAVSFIDRWKQDVISTHETMTQIIAQQLHQYSEAIINEPAMQSVFDRNSIDASTLYQIDSSLQVLSSIVLSEMVGLEGGFYLDFVNEFVGYSAPSLPPPKPVYGPPPRSYDIIKQQVMVSIAENREITKLHEFDPAIFPLTTAPIHIGSKVVGAVWVRIHIERKLPAYRIREVLNIIALVAMTGFFVAVVIFMSLQKRTRDIRLGLESIQSDPSYRFDIHGGTFGFIAESINSLVDNLDQEHRNLQALEKELHQQDKLASLGKLIAGVAHEVKTPLAIIKTRVQLWQQADKSIKSSEPIFLDSLDLVVQEINRLTRLVNRLLVFSKPINTDLATHDLNALMRETVSMLRVDHDKVSFSESYDENIPSIPMDHQAIKQVLINIITNSIHAAGEESEIKISTGLSSIEGLLSLRIQDNGPGISADILDKIFDPFFTTKKQGAGLGLSISYEIINAHSGKIRFVNEPSDGLTCIIQLPIRQET